MKENSADSPQPAFTVPATSGAVTGLAALGAVFVLPAAVDAAVVYSGIQNASLTLAANQRHASNATSGAGNLSAPLDLDGNAVNDFRMTVGQFQGLGGIYKMGFASIVPFGLNLVEGGEGGAFNRPVSSFVPGPFSYNNGLLRRVRSINSIPSASGYFANGVPGFAGVAFQIAGQTHFGWVRLQVDDGLQGFPGKMTAIDWAYESDANTRIHVELLVPEANPGMVLLAAGGTGLAAWRLRRSKQTKVAATA